MTTAGPLQNMPGASAAPPAALLPYQQAWIGDDSPLKIGEKSRRIGLTWAEAADDVLIASRAGGTNVFYIGPTQDMAFEYVEACAMWARAFNQAAGQIQDFLFEDVDSAGHSKSIKAYRIDFPGSGRRIVALSSRPANLRGKQGTVVIDEAAFHPDLAELLKAAMAMLLWGDKVRILSTHDGADNPFNELIQEVRAKKRGGTVHRITFRDAVAQGLFRRVCLRRGLTWSTEAEAQWVAAAYSFYGEAANEELDVIPSQGGGAYLTMALIESRMDEATPLVRGRWGAEFNLMPEPLRRVQIEEWCHEHLAPILDTLDATLWHAVGEDFGRVSDLTCIIVGEEGPDLRTRVRLIVELSNCPFSQQEQILFYIVDRIRRFRCGALDATGNGASLAEKAADRYGSTRIEQVKLSEAFYLENFPTMKGALEDGTLTGLPRDVQVRDDLRAVRLVNGVPKLPATKTQRGDGQRLTRHGDSAIALLMMHHAIKSEAVDVRGLIGTGQLRESTAGLADYLMGEA